MSGLAENISLDKGYVLDNNKHELNIIHTMQCHKRVQTTERMVSHTMDQIPVSAYGNLLISFVRNSLKSPGSGLHTYNAKY